ncbi:hypothetical protein Pelo_17840 [Pelomyxa schiedti]|nr:hypothetical protein Pelo_17840 [Pelomyxa schiedti]
MLYTYYYRCSGMGTLPTLLSNSSQMHNNMNRGQVEQLFPAYCPVNVTRQFSSKNTFIAFRSDDHAQAAYDCSCIAFDYEKFIIKLEHMAPELWKLGILATSEMSDVFAFGLVLLEILVERPVFSEGAWARVPQSGKTDEEYQQLVRMRLESLKAFVLQGGRPDIPDTVPVGPDKGKPTPLALFKLIWWCLETDKWTIGRQWNRQLTCSRNFQTNTQNLPAFDFKALLSLRFSDLKTKDFGE